MPIVSYKNNGNIEYTLGIMTDSGLENVVISSDGFYSVYYIFNSEKISKTGKILNVFINESNEAKSYILLDSSEDNFNRRERIYFEQIYYINDLTPNDAYRIAVKHGFVGTEQDWIDSMRYGKSAYEVACDNGFEGTEEEWLDSLNGPKGYDPVRGVDYWTEEDIEAIKSDISKQVKTCVADIHKSITNSANSAELSATKAQTFYNETVKLKENVSENAQNVAESLEAVRSYAVEVSTNAVDSRNYAQIASEAKGSIQQMETSVNEKVALVDGVVSESLEGAIKAQQYAHEAELYKNEIVDIRDDTKQFADNARESKNSIDLIKNEVIDLKNDASKLAGDAKNYSDNAKYSEQSALEARDEAISAKNDAQSARDEAQSMATQAENTLNAIQTEFENGRHSIDLELDSARSTIRSDTLDSQNAIRSELESAKSDLNETRNEIQSELDSTTALAEEAKRTAQEGLDLANSIYDRYEEASNTANETIVNANKTNEETEGLLNMVRELNSEVKETLVEVEGANGVVSDLVTKARVSETNAFNYAKSASYSMQKSEEYKNASELAKANAEAAAEAAKESENLADEYKNTIQESIDSIKNAEETVVTHEHNAASYAEAARASKEEAEQIIAGIDDRITKADSAMQPNVYDPNNNRTDIFAYTDQKAEEVQLDLNSVKDEIDDARSLTDTLRYDKVGDAIRGTIDLAKTYMHALLIDYKAFSIVFVDVLPDIGENRTFYLVPKETGNGYDKYWYVTDPDTSESKWDTFGGSSTIVVSVLPEVGDPDIDYILKTTSGCLYYKYINGNWEVVAGSLAYISNEGMPSVEIGNEFTDYYVKDGDSYTHYRFIDGGYKQIGSGSDIKNLIDSISRSVEENTTNIGINSENISSLSKSVEKLSNDMQNIEVEGYTYYHTITKSEDSDKYVLTLWQVKDGAEEIASRTDLPAMGGGGGGSSFTTITIERITPSPLVITSNDSAIIELNFSCIDVDGQTIDATYTWKKDNKTIIASGSMVQGINRFDFTEFCTESTQKFTLSVVDENGQPAPDRNWTVKVVNLSIQSNFNDRYTYTIGRDINFQYTPYGDVQKTVHFILDGVEIGTYDTTSSGVVQSFTIPAQPHGAHLFECYITANVNNTDVETNHIYKDIIWYNPDSDESGEYKEAVIGCIYRNDFYGKLSIRQYDSIAIEYNVFDPTTNYPIIKRYVDDNLVGTDNLDSSQSVWNFSSSDIGEHILKITTRNTTVIIVINVEELGIDVSPITNNLEIDFNPIGITNNSENRIWSNEKYAMSVSDNFDWANGGYKKDENNDAYFLIKAGTRVSFNYEMFGGGLNGNPSVVGAEMKVIFMTENVQDTNAVWFSNVESTVNEVDGVSTTTNVGIQMSVHEGWLKTNNASNSDVDDGSESVAATNTYLYMPYSEEDIIEMDINIDTIDRDDSAAKAFVMAYEDGVPSKAYVYSSSDRFYQYNPQPIVIGSDSCDVRIYRLKIYSAPISTEGIKRNFIADSRNSTTMLDRYDRNSIYYNKETNTYTPYSGEGKLDPERVAKVIPNVKVLMLDTDHFTTSKKTFVKSSLRCIHESGGKLYSGDPYYDNWLFENGWHSGQGTTSDNYGNAGRNVDFLFNCDGIHKPSDKVSAEADYVSQVTLGYGTETPHTEKVTDWKGSDGKVTLTRTSVPNNFFNLKVNIASSENVNNALLQKRYNDFLPYISPAKKRDPFVKNDMEFVPAILFLRETNPDISTHNEFLDNEWHFYAIGNIGDSKKTDYTRAYDPEDMNEFTLEISDNTKNNAVFQSGVYRDSDGELQLERFHIVKSLDKDGELVTTAISDSYVQSYVYPIPKDKVDDLWFKTGTITVENRTGDPKYDGDETGYLNMRAWCLYNEGFDGDHSFEPRYACCGDYRDGKLVNDTSGRGKKQVTTNNDVWRAFYTWVITATDEEFVNELDQWCVRSAVEFFYAFTHIYTMMDNRAKNTFWHFAKTGTYRKVSKPVKELLHVYCEKNDSDEYVPTMDTEINHDKVYYTQHAFDLWDYDNDTALGINNNGELVFPYGKEDTDYNIDGNASSGYIFNGATSVFWCRLRDLLAGEITNTFTSAAVEAFSATNLINQFDAFQECFPEEIWRLDIERKYIRTFTGESIDNSKPKKDIQYLRDMMQGRKKYQRRQWCRDQEFYFGTKNLMNTVVGDDNRITFRCFTPKDSNIVVTPDYTLRITPYSDMYLSVQFGNGNNPIQTRAKSGINYTIECPLDTMDDTQVTIYGADRIQALSDLSACYITTANNFSMATKLKKLVVGNTTEGYSNPKLTSLTLGNNKLLEELDIRNCDSLAGSLNLADCNNLLKLYAEGTKITGVAFATNGKLQVAHLPNTINTLTMRNLNNLVDFDAVLSRLETLTLQGGTLNSLDIITECINTLRTLYLYDIDWVVADTKLLNMMTNLFYSLVTGKVYVSGQIRSQEILNYSNTWNDLVVTFDEDNLVQQNKVTYVNADADNTVLYTMYVDKGSTPIDPYAEGLIDIPTLEADEQYFKTFGEYTENGEYIARSGWDNIDGPVTSDRVITAKYTKTLREYTVTWYLKRGVVLKSKVVPYGTEVVYDGDTPTDTSGEDAYTFKLFKGWDASTGYIRRDTDVYAVWDTAVLPEVGKELKDMSFAEMYAISKTKRAAEYFEDKDYFDFTMGHTFDFNNVESEILCENLMLDGNTAIDKDITLFDSDNPKSFTMAIDFKFGSNKSNGTLVSCFEENGSEGFRLRYSNNAPNIQWGDKNISVGNELYRDIVVLRYIAGQNVLYIYHTKSDVSGKFNPNVISATLVRTRSTNTKNIITLGGVRFTGDGGHDYYANGCIYSCKIWYDDLGHTNAMKLASWCHETMRMHYRGNNIYRLSGDTSGRAEMSFTANNSLSGRGYSMNTSSGGNIGGFAESAMIELCNGRIFDALPIELQTIIKEVKIPSSAGNMSKDIVNAECKVYLNSLIEVDYTATSEPYVNEGNPISWHVDGSSENAYGSTMTANATRIKFKGRIIDDNARYFFSDSDPYIIPSNNIIPGDIWVNTSESPNNGYIFISQEEIDCLGIAPSVAEISGGWISADTYWLRSPYASYGSTLGYAINKAGSANTLNVSGNNAVSFGFSF